MEGFQKKKVMNEHPKGQIKSEWIYEVIKFPKQQLKTLKDFCPERLYRLGTYVYSHCAAILCKVHNRKHKHLSGQKSIFHVDQVTDGWMSHVFGVKLSLSIIFLVSRIFFHSHVFLHVFLCFHEIKNILLTFHPIRQTDRQEWI